MPASIDDNLIKRNELLDKRLESFDSWLKGAIAIATGLIAILISFKGFASKTIEQHLYFKATIILLCSGILFGTACLYRQVAWLDRQRKALQEHIVKQSQGYQGRLLTFVGPPWYYRLFSFLSIISFLLSLIALVVYAIYMDK